MAEIRAGRDVVTVINVFSVAPEQQQALVDVLVEATEAVIRHLPGFVSASIHKGLDGNRVANYAQWRSRADLEAMRADPAAMAQLARVRELTTGEPHLYEVVAILDAHGAGSMLNSDRTETARP